MPARHRRELVADGAARQAYRAVDDGDIFFSCVNDCLLEGDVGVAFMGCDKPGGHLHASGAQLHDGVNILAGKDAASCDDRRLLMKA